MISFSEVTKVYNDTNVALNKLSFNVEKGEIVGFIGPNGSGKTTTMKLLSGIISPSSGKITVNGYDIMKDPLLVKKSIGYISDSPDIFLRLKGIEFLNFIADIYKVDKEKRKEKIESLASLFEIKDSLSLPMLSYSHGMRQKIMVISALLHDPDVWILDEPLTGLDPKSAYILKNMMKEHAHKGKTVFFSTHVLEVAEKLCDKIIIIYKGKKLFEGTLEELKTQYPEKALEDIFLILTNENNI